jgi:ABC-type multidrug transport system permease subunit
MDFCENVYKISLMEENERCIRSHRNIGHINVNLLSVPNFGNIDATLKHSDIRLLRQIFCELYDITCLINKTYRVPILANLYWLLTGVLYTLYEALINLGVWAVEDITYTIMFTALFFNVTYFCHTAVNEAACSGILVQKLLLG